MNNTKETLNAFRQSCGSRIVVGGKSCIAPILNKKTYDNCLIYNQIKDKHAKEILAWNSKKTAFQPSCGDNRTADIVLWICNDT